MAVLGGTRVMCVPILVLVVLFSASEAKWKPPNVTVYPEDFDDSVLYKMIANLGLEKETYNVATDDGYILCLTRLVLPEKKNKADKGVPMLMVNGLFLQSEGWLLHVNPMDNAAIYWLAHGYDIWMGDQRGTERSRKHKKYDAMREKKYWDFTFHETGVYDLPAFIDFILRKTEHKKVCYSGLSLGTTFAFVMLAERPEYNDKVHVAVQFVPVGDMPLLSTRSLTTQIQFNMLVHIMEYYNMMKSGAFMLDMKTFRYHIRKLCTNIPHLFAWGMQQTAGPGLSMEPTYMCNQLGMQYASSSTNTFLHTIQLFYKGEFRKFDWGKEKNMEKYGTEQPPFYNYSNIVAPIASYYSDLDEYSPAYVVKRMMKKFKGPTYSCLIEKTHHTEPLFGSQYGQLYNEELLHLLDSATGRSSPDKLKSGECSF